MPTGCGYTWHTFATHGICPSCSKMWHLTQCPRCKLWSPIEDWYHEDLPLKKRAKREKQSESQSSDQGSPDWSVLPASELSDATIISLPFVSVPW
jgi:hypothetical protein